MLTALWRSSHTVVGNVIRIRIACSVRFAGVDLSNAMAADAFVLEENKE
jgi:hypothetical protein